MVSMEMHPAVENNTYELVEMTSTPEKGCSKNQTEMKREKKEYCFKIFITIIAVTALSLVLIFLSLFLVHDKGEHNQLVYLLSMHKHDQGEGP